MKNLSVGDTVLISSQPANQCVKIIGESAKIMEIEDDFAQIITTNGGHGTVPLCCLTLEISK